MKVTLLNYTPQPMRTMAAGALLCYQKGGPEEAWKKAGNDDVSALLRSCIDQDHGSVLEHADFTFGIEGISRACSHQLVRHRLCSFSQQSQRYVDLSRSEQDWYVYPRGLHPELDAELMADAMGDAMGNYECFQGVLREHGLEGEEVNQDARYVLPNACKTNIIWTLNFRQLMHVAHVRLCKRAQWEIREMMEQLVTVMKTCRDAQVAWLGTYVKSMCQHIGYCPQGSKGCGDYPTKDAVTQAAEDAGLYQSK